MKECKHRNIHVSLSVIDGYDVKGYGLKNWKVENEIRGHAPCDLEVTCDDCKERITLTDKEESYLIDILGY